MSNLSPAVLYVEDDPNSRRIMQILLVNRMKLTDVTIFEDSRDFAERVRALQPIPDIVFLDIHMEPIDGFEMLAILRALPGYARVPIVALTASIMNEEVAKLQSGGFSSVIAKPIDLGAFPETLRRLLNGHAVWQVVE